MKKTKRGFTLIELLVVVIIIAILTAIAVPQYKHAALKSRFSTVMPMAKSIADAQEVYYQGRQMYALSTDELDVTPVNAENTSVSLSQTDGYDYVMAQNSQVPGANYIIYQKYSENYPSEIHCEAENDNDDAQWLCGVLSNNNSIGQTITPGYTTYLINGTGAGVVPGYSLLLGLSSCADVTDPKYTCTNTIDQQSNTATKTVCTKSSANQDVCFETRYNQDGSFLRYSSALGGGGKTRVMKYDKDGNILAVWTAEINTPDSVTGQGYDYIYDGNGNLTSISMCATRDPNTHQCSSPQGQGYIPHYDGNGRVDAFYRCMSMNASGDCATNSSYVEYSFTYGANGKLATTTYELQYIYDEDDNLLGINTPSTGAFSYQAVLDGTGSGMVLQKCQFRGDVLNANGQCPNGTDSNYHYSCFDLFSCSNLQF